MKKELKLYRYYDNFVESPTWPGRLPVICAEWLDKLYDLIPKRKGSVVYLVASTTKVRGAHGVSIHRAVDGGVWMTLNLADGTMRHTGGHYPLWKWLRTEFPDHKEVYCWIELPAKTGGQ